jgi:hypothetical protein
MATKPVIDSREIHVWCTFSVEMHAEARLPGDRNRSGDRERKQELHLYFAHDRRRYVTTQALVRPIPSRHFDIAPKPRTFTTRRYHFTSPEEIAGLPQSRRWLEYWTVKASYMKAKGGAFSIPLDRFSFHFPHDDLVSCSTRPDSGDLPDRLRFWELSLGSRYLVAVCAERVRRESPRLVLREVVPLQGPSNLARHNLVAPEI